MRRLAAGFVAFVFALSSVAQVGAPVAGASRTFDSSSPVPVASGGTGATTALGASAAIGATHILCKTYVAVAGAADTAENTLGSCTVPANAMGANGGVIVYTHWTFTNNANVKTLRVRYSGIGGTAYFAPTKTTNISSIATTYFGNRNATNSQAGGSTEINGNNTVFGTGGVTTSAIDSTASTTIVATCQKATAGDTCQLESMVVLLLANGS